jgi:hypothetical protein
MFLNTQNAVFVKSKTFLINFHDRQRWHERIPSSLSKPAFTKRGSFVAWPVEVHERAAFLHVVRAGLVRNQNGGGSHSPAHGGPSSTGTGEDKKDILREKN